MSNITIIDSATDQALDMQLASDDSALQPARLYEPQPGQYGGLPVVNLLQKDYAKQTKTTYLNIINLLTRFYLCTELNITPSEFSQRNLSYVNLKWHCIDKFYMNAFLDYASQENRVNFYDTRQSDNQDSQNHTKFINTSLAPNTKHLYLSVLKLVVEECFALELISDTQYLHCKRVKIRTKKHVVNPGEAFTDDVMLALEQSCQDGGNEVKNARDYAMFTLLLRAGLRVGECVNFSLDHLNQRTGFITITGKGNRTRRVKIHDNVIKRLVAYEAIRNKAAQMYSDTRNQISTNLQQTRFVPLFNPLSWRGSVIMEDGLPKKLSRKGVSSIIASRFSALEGYEYLGKPHNFRRTFATTLYENGIDLMTIKEMLGHSSIETTKKYVTSNQDKHQVQAVEKMALNATSF
jgi:site-specific recombinase XerD